MNRGVDREVTARLTCLILLVAAVAALAATVHHVAAAQAPAPQAAATTSRGKAVYDEHCVECHGVSGKGDGPAAAMLKPRPRDLTAGKYKIRSTESGSVPTDDDLLRSIRQGLRGTAMPGWQSVLSADDIQQVSTYIKGFSPRFAESPPRPIETKASVPASPESLARGWQVYQKLQCAKCHGDDGRGTHAAVTTFQDDWQQPIRAADLSESWTFRGGATSADIFMRFRAGMSGSPMPSFKDAATDAEMWDLANYVVSLARKPVWEMNAQEVADFYRKQDEQARQNPARRGEYLVDSLGCALCHSPFDENKRMLPGFAMAGGLRIRLEPFGEYPSGNLTSDKETGLGTWSDQEIKTVLTRGILRDGTRLLPYPMDWGSFGTMKEDDLNAIVAYLRTIPPVRNKVPRPSRTFLPMYMWGKFKMLFLGDDPPMIFYAGNIGTR